MIGDGEPVPLTILPWFEAFCLLKSDLIMIVNPVPMTRAPVKNVMAGMSPYVSISDEDENVKMIPNT